MANIYVRQGAGGANNGTDWTNAYTAFPSMGSITRGDTIYMADGSYAGLTMNKAVSGTTLITVKKATISSHGTSTGWSDTYGDGLAAFTSECQVTTNYWAFDGVSRNADWDVGGADANGGVDEYGLRFNNLRFDNGSGSGCSHVTFTYCDIHGDGRDTGSGDDCVYSLVANDSITFQYCALRDSDRTIWITAGGGSNWIIDHCYIGRNTSSAAVHAEMWSCWGTFTTVQFSNNIVEDIEGTAIFAGINDGTMSQWDIYGNVFKYTDAMLANNYTAFEGGGSRPAVGSGPGEHNGGIVGVMFVANDGSNNNFADHIRVYNNSMHGIKLGSTLTGIVIQAGSGSNVVKNNIWYDCTATAHSITGGSTIDYNWYYLTTSSGDSGANKQTGSADPFVDEDANDYHLTAATNPGDNLGSPYNIDPDGVTRTDWDRGAFEFVSGGGPAAPTGFRRIN